MTVHVILSADATRIQMSLLPRPVGRHYASTEARDVVSSGGDSRKDRAKL